MPRENLRQLFRDQASNMAVVRGVLHDVLRLSRFHRDRLGICNRLSCTQRWISTSNKSKDTTSVTEAIIKKPPITEEGNATNDDWISYGFSETSEKEDRHYMKIVMFCTVTIALVGGAFMFAYQPDSRGVDWVRREGFLELHRREKLGLPLIDPNLIDPSKIVLPDDDELGSTEIII